MTGFPLSVWTAACCVDNSSGEPWTVNFQSFHHMQSGRVQKFTLVVWWRHRAGSGCQIRTGTDNVGIIHCLSGKLNHCNLFLERVAVENNNNVRDTGLYSEVWRIVYYRMQIAGPPKDYWCWVLPTNLVSISNDRTIHTGNDRVSQRQVV